MRFKGRLALGCAVAATLGLAVLCGGGLYFLGLFESENEMELRWEAEAAAEAVGRSWRLQDLEKGSIAAYRRALRQGAGQACLDRCRERLGSLVKLGHFDTVRSDDQGFEATILYRAKAIFEKGEGDITAEVRYGDDTGISRFVIRAPGLVCDPGSPVP